MNSILECLVGVLLLVVDNSQDSLGIVFLCFTSSLFPRVFYRDRERRAKKRLDFFVSGIVRDS